MELVTEPTDINTKMPAFTASETKLLILENNFTVVGIRSSESTIDGIVLTHAAFVVRSNGSIGELSLKGPNGNVSLQRSGNMRITYDKIVIMIDCVDVNWVEWLVKD